MSYCRWSSDNWRCDLYCYESGDNEYTTHVAGRRRVGLETLPPNPLSDLVHERIDADEWMRRYKAHHAMLQSLPFEDIDLPHAGETFCDASLEEFKDRLLYLRKVGYHFPDYVLETVDAEIADAAAKERNTS